MLCAVDSVNRGRGARAGARGKSQKCVSSSSYTRRAGDRGMACGQAGQARAAGLPHYARAQYSSVPHMQCGLISQALFFVTSHTFCDPQSLHPTSAHALALGLTPHRLPAGSSGPSGPMIAQWPPGLVEDCHCGRGVRDRPCVCRDCASAVNRPEGLDGAGHNGSRPSRNQKSRFADSMCACESACGCEPHPGCEYARVSPARAAMAHATSPAGWAARRA